jgi:histidinol-phosphate/aromatic aminotransferase/cobyric acid decarboxylase-like protein
MRARGILVRDRHHEPGCAGCVRITLGTAEHNERLLAVLRETVEEIRRPSEVQS